MKQLTLLIIALTVSTFCYAGSLSEQLGTAWKTQQTMHAKEAKNDITIVYGGADISVRPSTTLSKTIA